MGSNFENHTITVALETLGCKLNQAETEQLARQLAEAGCKVVSPEEPADIYILNTCTVTHVADRKARHLLRMAHRNNPSCRIVALGCLADRAAGELSRIEGVDLVAGNDAKDTLPQLLADKGFLKVTRKAKAKQHRNRTRSFIKAQDGCNNSCSYCIVPLVRGREKSLPADQVIDEINKRVADGFQEVILTGTEIGRYQSDGLDLKGLIVYILQQTEIIRLRLSSVQPDEVKLELISLWQNPRLCRHFHISLQSGSDTVLQRMNRHYTADEFAKTVASIRAEIPDAAITTDIIVGFPGETEAEFQQSYDLCREMRFSRMHVFPYSPREGTRAAKMEGQLPSSVKKQRSEKMLALAKTSLQNFSSSCLGRSETVLFEQGSQGIYSGFTGTYIKVYAKSESDLTNKIIQVKLVELFKDGVWGELVSD